PGQIDGVRAEVRFGQPPLLGRREARLHDAPDIAAGVAHHPPVGVVRPDRGRQQRDRRPTLRPERAEAVEGGSAERRRIPVEHEDLAVALLGGLDRDADRVAGPAHLGLHGDRRVRRQDRPRLLLDVRGQHDDRPRARAERRVPLAAELALAGLATAAAELRVAFAAELPFPSLPALSAEVGVATGAELLLAGLTATAADLAVELGAVLGGRVLSALAPGL